MCSPVGDCKNIPSVEKVFFQEACHYLQLVLFPLIISQEPRHQDYTLQIRHENSVVSFTPIIQSRERATHDEDQLGQRESVGQVLMQSGARGNVGSQPLSPRAPPLTTASLDLPPLEEIQAALPCPLLYPGRGFRGHKRSPKMEHRRKSGPDRQQHRAE